MVHCALIGVLAMATAELPSGAATAALELPSGAAPPALTARHFPDRLHAFVWRNWSLVPAARMAGVVGATSDDIRRIGRSMGLQGPPRITRDMERRSYITVIRRNWHLLPYDQLLDLLGWTERQLAFTLREDDFLFIKLGSLKPRCEPLRYQAPDATARAAARRIAERMRTVFPEGVGTTREPHFQFVRDLSSRSRAPAERLAGPSRFQPRFCYSYFALFGDPLAPGAVDSYPDGYLARMAASGVDGIWLHAVLYKLAPFPWDPALSEGADARLASLRRLVQRARRHGIGVYLYLNEPRTMPLRFFERHPGLRGVQSGDHATLCTSVPEVRAFLTSAVERICRAAPGLAGLFTITASENLTNCWSHSQGAQCPRCSQRAPHEVIAELHTALRDGIARSGSHARLIAWDWGWPDAWAEPLIGALPDGTALMSVSEWNLPIERGGVRTEVGEYSLSAIGPGPRATRHWELARRRGLPAFAKIQAANTWEMSAVPYVPAVENTALHAAALRTAGISGVMLGWTLGGYPSPNIGVVARLGATDESPREAMLAVARQRYGDASAPGVVDAWRLMSEAFREFPFHIGVVYTSPHQSGPANLLWESPTGYAATMVGIAYDDLDAWRAVFPPEVYIRQMDLVAEGFSRGAAMLAALERDAPEAHRRALRRERGLADTVRLHMRSAANQARFVMARRALAAAQDAASAAGPLAELERVLREEAVLAADLYRVQSADSRVGYEATNHYFYVPLDLAEKVLNCYDLLERWLPEERRRRGL